ncbi:brain acid soluble protein 1 [Oryza brachyantha]|uniref:brain acid soluble protein 1 n=1 Tax=Oryza brachyantha TaxID=4533 RepID=UPI001ADD592E|nr:brain acid soluble protein 1 [Oryza brachyantha]
MGSCVSKKDAARAGAVAKEVAPPLPPEKELALPVPVVVVVEEEVKEVLSETAVPVSRPRPPEPEEEVVKRRLERKGEVEEEEGSESASVSSATAEKAKAMAKGGVEQGLEQKVVDGAEKVRATRTPEKRRPKEAGNGRTRSPSPASAQRRQGAGEHAALPPRPRREQPAVVSSIGCRSGRFSPSAARRAAESAVRRTHSAREADMMLPHSSRTPAAKRSLNATVNGNANAHVGGAPKRDPGERSGRRPDSPTSKRVPPASPAANGVSQRPQHSLNGGGVTRKTARENTTLEQTKPQCGSAGGRTPPEDPRESPDESTLEHAADGGGLVQNPSVAMECFIFL